MDLDSVVAVNFGADFVDSVLAFGWALLCLLLFLPFLF